MGQASIASGIASVFMEDGPEEIQRENRTVYYFPCEGAALHIVLYLSLLVSHVPVHVNIVMPQLCLSFGKS